MASNAQHLIWIDLEMTGLDTQNDAIIEIATIVTDKNLNEVAQGPVVAIHQTQEVLDKMDEWNQTHHGQSGLVQRVQQSSESYTSAQNLTLAFLAEYVPSGVSPMCGNSICQDRRFLARLMPELEAYFHYRNLDVSTVKELANRWYPAIANQYNKTSKHLALDDIRDSIEELKFYRDRLFPAV